MEHAIGELARSSTCVDRAMVYWGSNMTETGEPDWFTPLECARNPSYAVENESVQNPADSGIEPLQLTIDGTPLGVSGMMDHGTYAPNGDVFRLRVSDANSMIFVNDGLADGLKGHVTRNLKRILNVLGSLSTVGVPGAGDRIIDHRPVGGYRSRGQLESVLGSSDYRKIAHFVTTEAWIDRDAINPVPLSTAVLGAYPVSYNSVPSLYRYGPSRDAAGSPITAPLRFAPEYASPTGTDHAVMALDELNAQWIERTRRAPVNVNLASREVLIALITGLRGWFLTERRKTNPGSDFYAFLNHPKYENARGGRRGDEVGYLYSTAEFVAPGGTGTGTGISAADVADEIIHCRSRRRSPLTGIDYAAVWYGGHFRSWRQFNAFCDGLVGTLLTDPRNIFHDFTCVANTNLHNGPDTLVASTLQRQFASRALADTLKANFNPNVTLNELNPDANLYTIVDKTDLICNSTEFCFKPMGIFQIECEGLVVRTDGAKNLREVLHGELVARRKVSCTVKVFDAYRTTTQADFYEGVFGRRTAGPVTNNNKTMESGPEPDNGPAAGTCRWSGWLQLSTVGGHWSGTQSHAPDTLETTPAGTDEHGSVIHSHFTLDHRLHHHVSGARDLVASTAVWRNNADRTEAVAGPYNPTVGPPGRYRLARHWEASSPPPSPAHIAAGDLRLDGIYVERDSAAMYRLDQAVYDAVGTVAMWIKPAFHPEMTGKPKTFFSLDTRRNNAPMINAFWFFASHDAPAGAASPNEGTAPFYFIIPSGRWRPASLVAGYSLRGGVGGGVGVETNSLNHRAHADSATPDVLRRGGWTHVAYSWSMGVAAQRRCHLWINGEVQPGTADVWVHQESPVATALPSDWLETFPDNPLRLGEPSKTFETGPPSLIRSRNWAADSTLDEFYVWRGMTLDAVQDLYALGRYYRSLPEMEATYTSAPVPLPAAGGRQLPPPSHLAAPTGYAAPVPSVAASATPQVTVLAVDWTWFAESTSTTGAPRLHDHYAQDELEPTIELEFLVNGTPAGGTYQDDRGSPVTGVSLDPDDVLTYRLRVRVPGTRDTILHATPVIDDVTIYYSTGVEFLSYTVHEVSA